MSTIKVTNVSHPSAASPAIVLDADGDATYSGVHDFSAATVTGAPQGLELLSFNVLSGSIVNINNCFSSTYRRYRMLARVTSSEADTQLVLRFRASGTSTTSNYKSQVFQASGSSISGTRVTTQSYLILTVIGSGAPTFFTYDFDSPFLTQSTLVDGRSNAGRTSPEIWTMGGTQTDTTSFDGFTLIANAGTMSGSFNIYGYKD
jgi:hypothetical protein